jgi:hypothetical protein
LPFFQEMTVEMGLLGALEATETPSLVASRERADTLLMTQASIHTPAKSSRHFRVLIMVLIGRAMVL